MSALWNFSFVVFLTTALLTFGSAHNIEARPAQPHQGPPDNVRYFEPLTNVVTKAAVSAQQGSGREQLHLSFNAFGKQFDLQLEPNDLIAPHSQNIWIGDGTENIESSTPLFYKGEIKGQPGSWVRISMKNGIMDGMIQTQDETYFVEPGERFLSGASSHKAVMYRQSDAVSDWKPGSCALDHPAVASAMAQHASKAEPLSDYDAMRAELQALAGSTLEQINIGIVADYEYFQKHGASSAADMQNIINQVDGIFRAELGVTLRVTKTVVYTTPSDPFSSTTNPEALLDELTSYKGKAASPVYGTGLAHLFTRRALDGDTIGIGWIGTICDSSYGSGLSQDFTTSNKSLVLLTAHEIGHNFDAPHDNQSQSACASTPMGYIMNPWVDPGLNTKFSSCSKSFIAPMVANARCLATVTDLIDDLDDPVPSCTYSLSLTSQTHKAKAGQKKIKVKASTDCAWTAVSNVGWITILSGVSGTGKGKVNYRVEANPTMSPRTGTLTIAGQIFTVNQKGRTQ